MPAAKGSACKLYIGDGAPSETFSLIGGIQVSGFDLNYMGRNGANLSNGPWRMLASEQGEASVRISARGLFTDTATEQTVRAKAISGLVANYRMTFGSGDYLQGPFRVTRYARSGDVERLEAVDIVLESAGTVSYTQG